MTEKKRLRRDRFTFIWFSDRGAVRQFSLTQRRTHLYLASLIVSLCALLAFSSMSLVLYSDILHLKTRLKEVKGHLFSNQVRYEGVYEKAYEKNTNPILVEKSANLAFDLREKKQGGEPDIQDKSRSMVTLPAINVGGEDVSVDAKLPEMQEANLNAQLQEKLPRDIKMAVFQKKPQGLAQMMANEKTSNRWRIELGSINFDDATRDLSVNFSLIAKKSWAGKRQVGYVALALAGFQKGTSAEPNEPTWFFYPSDLQYSEEQQAMVHFKSAERFAIRRLRNFKQTWKVPSNLSFKKLVVVSLDDKGHVMTWTSANVFEDTDSQLKTSPSHLSQRPEAPSSTRQSH